ncbi:MAG: hypothetical protein UR31_C0036G0010 [Parcubacteria group bacterium GW2011_GWA2_33_14]|uniref:Uncharacterized protein n=1 Tax=Candidatus Staskawiczbacteria bacterium RIFCSPHIGHO2_02_FULL_33_16 TaxID=1802204 RepID=A0A1G2HWE0_9BACT|nr:MAG: hypothetical protein UR31_C0036G0010 [Parcubacteria group bacterium GW2011_GWA2_33_14]OGZ66783.1 MAG: hypothetical protein A3D34_03685 [Candidatus Staskawiczbacteria bacterium RIFCSPHIGHO2_02_FULL_33_16]OGZ70891.1 MAG: hypothetical protein A2980_02600 [Candidatus Staskawiczbacteria bacterium RIFCSPLOWO2_01_FULL_33_13]
MEQEIIQAIDKLPEHFRLIRFMLFLEVISVLIPLVPLILMYSIFIISMGDFNIWYIIIAESILIPISVILQIFLLIFSIITVIKIKKGFLKENTLLKIVIGIGLLELFFTLFLLSYIVAPFLNID